MNCIKHNNALYGAGIYLNDSYAILNENTISNNKSKKCAGGLLIDNKSKPIIDESNVIEKNIPDNIHKEK